MLHRSDVVRVPGPESIVALCARMTAATSVEALRDALLEGLLPYGFMGFTFAAIRKVKSVYLHSEIIATWPRGLQTRFQQHALFNADPVIVRSRTAPEAFAWDLSLYVQDNPVHAQILALRMSVGIAGGICVPVSEAFQGRSVLYLSGRGFDTSAKTILALQLLAEHFAVRTYSLGGHEERGGKQTSHQLDSGELSPREREVVAWLAFGKSSREVATIMAISEHTVNDYITSCVTKLHASNRTEAVLRALLTNQMDLS
jgi:LuxR family transcriptional regulator, quorum-sensing system regulator BjaR1